MSKQEKMDSFFITIADDFAGLSHCVRVKVGAVIVKDGRIISTGYNGTPPGFENCDDHFAPMAHRDIVRMRLDYSNITRDQHAEFSKYEIHAEMNALSVAGATIYVSYSPCIDCAKAIIASGITRVVYDKPYDRSIEGLEFLKLCGIEVVHHGN